MNGGPVIILPVNHNNELVGELKIKFKKQNLSSIKFIVFLFII